jgi:hypothetical protein
MLNNVKPDIDGEIDEFQRLSQDLKRDDDIDVSVDEVIKAFKNASEETLTDEVWQSLENTESNEIEKGEWDKVFDIAKKYKKTNPKKLRLALKNGDYKRPLIVKINDRHILVAGNTRLSTAAAMGMNPKVFIGKIGEDMDVNKLISKAHSDITRTKGKEYAPTAREIEDKIKGGLSDRMSLQDLAKKHKVDVEHINKQFKLGLKVEMEHTNQKEVAKEIVKDHLYEDPNYYTKLKKIEANEATDSGSSGAFSAALSSPIKRPISKIHNTKKYGVNEEEEFKEATLSSSSGQYDVPFGGGVKGRKNPLKIDGEKSIKNSRAVKDKKFPKWGGPDSVFIKVKEKCKKFPYCNQGINAIELLEINELNEAINETSKNLGVPKKEIEKLVLNEISKIFM